MKPAPEADGPRAGLPAGRPQPSGRAGRKHGKHLVYVGTYTEPILFGTGQVLQGQGKGIYAFLFDPGAGTLTRPSLPRTCATRPIWPSIPERTFLYCVNEYKEYEGRPAGRSAPSASTGRRGGLTYLNSIVSHGTDPCHLIVDRRGRYVLVANFAAGATAVLPIAATAR